MKEENKKDIKKGILTGAGTAGGAVIGTIVEKTMNAADAEVRELPEIEVVEAIVDEDSGVQETGQPAMAEAVDIEMRPGNPATRITKPERKPVQVNSVEKVSDTETVSASAMVDEEENDEAGAESTEAIVEDFSADEDIMVVSVEPAETDEVDTADYDISQETEAIAGMPEDNHDVPDYMDVKDTVTGAVNPIASDLDMPDYVNDANIDSFTDNV